MPATRSALPKYDSLEAKVRLHINCVFLSCFGSDFQYFRSILYHDGIRLYPADTLDAADFMLTVTSGKVLISDTVFLDGSWRDAVAMLETTHPHVALLIAADEADRQFVSDAPDSGAFAVLWKPLTAFSLGRLIKSAHEASNERSLSRRESAA